MLFLLCFVNFDFENNRNETSGQIFRKDGINKIWFFAIILWTTHGRKIKQCSNNPQNLKLWRIYIKIWSHSLNHANIHVEIRTELKVNSFLLLFFWLVLSQKRRYIKQSGTQFLFPRFFVYKTRTINRKSLGHWNHVQNNH